MKTQKKKDRDLYLLRLAKKRHEMHKNAIAMAWATVHGNPKVVMEIDEKYKTRDEWREVAHAAMMELAHTVMATADTTGEEIDNIFRAIMDNAIATEKEGDTLLNCISWSVSRGLQTLKDKPAEVLHLKPT